MHRNRLPAVCLAMLLALAAQSQAVAAGAVSLYGNYHAMGITVTIAGTDDPDLDAQTKVEYRVSGAPSYQIGFPLTRIDATHWVGSLFWLQPDTRYDVRLTITDPDGGPLNNAVLTASGGTRAEPVVPTAVTSYYISASGNDANAGTAASPFATVAKALTLAQPGDHVVLRGGTYYQGDIAIPRSGLPGKPIVIRNYPGETVLFEGSERRSYSWTYNSDRTWSTVSGISDPHLVCSNDNRLYRYKTLSDCANLLWGVSGFYASGTTLYVRLAGDVQPSTYKFTVSRYNTCFSVSGRNDVLFSGLRFTNYGLYLTGNRAEAIYVSDSNDIVVEKCVFDCNDMGVYVTNNSNRLTVQDCEFFDDIFDWPWDAVKAEDNLEAMGLVHTFSPFVGRGLVVRRNKVHDTFDGMCVSPYTKGPWNGAGVSNEVDVYDNLIYRACDDGIETDGQTCNTRIWGNTFHDMLAGISICPVYTGPVYCLRNIGYGGAVGGGSGRLFKIGRLDSGAMYLFHNSSTNNKGFYISDGTWELLYARNNVWHGTVAYAVYNSNLTEPCDLDYDAYYKSWGDIGGWRGTTLNSVANIYPVAGQEQHVKGGNPLFVDSKNGNFNLQSGSPLINAGLYIPGINDGFAGTAPDIGAREYGAAAPVNYTLTTSVTPTGGGTVTRSPNATSYAAGTVVTLTATPASGYQFTGWSGAATGTNATISVTMDANKAVTANFALIPIYTYTLTTSITPTGGGTVTRSPNATSYAAGTVVTLTATPASGYQFTGWSGAATGTNATISVTMDANKAVTASFAAIPQTTYFTLTTKIYPAGAGSITKNPDAASYSSGTVVWVTAVAAPGYAFSYWSGSPNGTSPESRVTMNGNKTAVANFVAAAPMYALATQVQPTAAGTVAKSPDASSYPSGTAVTLTATAAAGYAFIYWSGSPNSTLPQTTLTMDADKTAVANFVTVEPTYTLTTKVYPAGAGTILKDPDLAAYPKGTVVTVTAAAAPGYQFSYWRGSPNGTSPVSEVRMIGNNKTAIAYFVASSGSSAAGATAATLERAEAASAEAAAPAIALECYGTRHAMGVTVHLNPADDPDGDVTATVEYRPAGAAAFQRGFPLARVTPEKLVGSLFWLQPGVRYEVRVTLADPDGGPLQGAVLTGAAETRTDPVAPAPARSWHVSPIGNDTTGDGSIGNPFGTVAHGLDAALPGDAVVLRGGTYHEGAIAPPRAGETGRPIVLRGYPGEQAILSGADPRPRVWAPTGEGVFSTEIDCDGLHLVTANGQRLYAYASFKDVKSLSEGVPGFFVEGTRLYVHLAGGADPNAAAMAVSRHNHALNIQQGGMQVMDLTFQCYGVWSEERQAAAILVQDARDVLIQSCTFAVNDLGILLAGTAQDAVVQGNTFFDTVFAWPFEALDADPRLDAGGVRVDSLAAGRGLVVRRNIFRDLYHAARIYPVTPPGPALSNETDIYENIAVACASTAFEVNGQACNVRFWRNAFGEMAAGIFLMPAHTGPVYAIRNVSCGDYVPAGSGSLFALGGRGTAPIFLFHNASTSPDGLLVIDGAWTYFMLRNNAFHATRGIGLYLGPMDQPIDADYNNYQSVFPMLGLWGRRWLRDLAALQAAAPGQERHGLSVPSGFVNGRSGDHRLKHGSSLIDAGVAIPGINDGFAGAAPDIGAHEHVDGGTMMQP